MSRAQLTSTVEQNSAGVASPFVAGKNKIINGDFGIWQRGTSFTQTNFNAGNIYTADRSAMIWNAVPTSVTVSQQTFTPGSAPVAGYEGTYYWQSAITTVGSCTIWGYSQRIEDVRQLAGQSVTVSFWAKADSARNVAVELDQNFGSGGSSLVIAGPTTIAVTTSWARYSATFSLPSISGKTIGTNSYLQLFIAQAAASGSTLNLWGVQVEAGSVATAFSTATGTVQGELSLCLRYFRRFGGNASQTRVAVGWCPSGSSANYIIPLTTPMRAAPSVSISTLSSLLWYDGTTGGSFTGFGPIIVTYHSIELGGTGSSGLTTGRAVGLTFDNIGTYMDWSAEL